MPVPAAVDRFTESARFHDCRYAANPLADGTLPPIPGAAWAAELHERGPTRIVPLDLSAALHCGGPATTPTLSANFLHLCPGDGLITAANATSQLFFAMRGTGTTRLDTDGEIPWRAGDLFAVPAGGRATHVAGDDAAVWWVHDEPLLRHLGVEARLPRFAPTLYAREAIRAAIETVTHDRTSAAANRLGVLLGNRLFPQTMTITQVCWAMVGLLPVNAVQAPQRVQSAALHLVVDAKPGCHTLVGPALDKDGRVREGRRFDWEPHAAFLTPPGTWHSHHNDSGFPAHVLVVQDAGLHAHLRTLDLRFARSLAGGGCEVVEAAG